MKLSSKKEQKPLEESIKLNRREMIHEQLKSQHKKMLPKKKNQLQETKSHQLEVTEKISHKNKTHQIGGFYGAVWAISMSS